MPMRQSRSIYLRRLWSSGAPRGTALVRRARRDRARHRCRRGIRGQPADIVARTGAIRRPGRYTIVRPGQSSAPIERLRPDHARARTTRPGRNAFRHRTHRRTARSGYRPGTTGLSSFAGELVCTRTTSTLPEFGARDRIRLVPRARARDHGEGAVRPSRYRASPRRVPRGMVLFGAGCMSNSSVWPFRAGTGWPAEPGYGCPRRPRNRSSHLATSSACGSSPTNSGRRRTSTLTSSSRPPRSRRWKGWSRPDSASPSFPFRATAVTPRPFMSRCPTPGQSARWAWCGQKIEQCRHRRSALRDFSVLM